METIGTYLLFIAACIIGKVQNSEALNIKPDNARDSNFSIIRFDPRIHFMFDQASKNSNLSEKDVAVVEKLLEQSVDDYNFHLSKDTLLNQINSPLDLTQYKRQLIAVKTSKGETEVFINCFCASAIDGLYQSGIDWRKDYFKANDGGSCYFRLYVNLTTKTYHHFFVNGYA